MVLCRWQGRARPLHARHASAVQHHTVAHRGGWERDGDGYGDARAATHDVQCGRQPAGTGHGGALLQRQQCRAMCQRRATWLL
eukprot:COSAG02_NODE_8189_length_2668_cov_496.662125_2_plen_83_part_00